MRLEKGQRLSVLGVEGVQLVSHSPGCDVGVKGIVWSQGHGTWKW
jgi:hypothetical protein